MRTYSIKVSKIQEINLLIGDIIGLNVDVIVNPTDTQLYTEVKGTISNQIWEKGGENVQKEIQKLREGKKLDLNNVYITKGGNFKAKYLFHVPLRPLKSKKLGRTPSDVFDVVLNVLGMTRKKNLNSIAIPSLGESQSLVDAQARGFVKFLRDDSLIKKALLQIFLVVTSDEHFDTYKVMLDGIQEQMKKASKLPWQRQVIEIFQSTKQRLLPEEEEEDFFQKFEEAIEKQREE